MGNDKKWLDKTNEELEAEYFRAYYDLRKYKTSDTDWEISFGLHSPGGGTIGEIIMHWVHLGDRMVPQLQAFDDSWRILSCFSDLMAILAKHDSDNITPDDFIKILKENNFLNPQEMWDGDFISDEMFKQYQIQRQRNNNLKQLI
jgi:hypothetical protein